MHKKDLLKSFILSIVCFISACASFHTKLPEQMGIPQVVQQAQALAGEDKWRKAKQLLTAAEKKLGQTQDLQEALAKVRSEEYQAIRHEKIAELIKRSEWLEQSYSLQHSIIQSDQISLWALLKFQSIKRSHKKVAIRLLEYGHIAAGQSNYELAQRCYTAIKRLSIPDELQLSYHSLGYSVIQAGNLEPNLLAGSLVNKRNHLFVDGQPTINDSIPSPVDQNKKTKQALAQYAQKASKRKRHLVKRLKRSLATPDVLSTAHLVDQLKQIKPLGKKELSLINEAKSSIEAQGYLLDQHAEQLYGEGYIAAANGIWATLLEVDDTNLDWQSKYLRSQKVLSNLKHLREVTAE